MIDALKELEARLEKAEGPSRELDAAVHAISGLDDPSGWYDPKDDCYMWYEHVDFGSTTTPMPVGNELPTYSFSLDACLALQEKVLPRWTRCVDATAPHLDIDVILYLEGLWPEPSGIRGQHAHEPIAWLLAIVRAKIWELENK